MATLQSSTVAGNAVFTQANYGLVIDRGNPGTGSMLTLSSLGESHLYYANSTNILDIATTMVEDAVYELFYVGYGANANQDPILYPNFTSYASAFSCYYWGSPGVPLVFDQPSNSGFYFDHYGGGSGVNPIGIFTIFNQRAKKLVHYRGGDSGSTCTGTARWNDSTTQWSGVGRLTGIQTMTTMKAIVRRIA